MSTNTVIVIVMVAVLFLMYSGKKPASASGGTPTGNSSSDGGTNVPTGNSTGGLAETVGAIGATGVALINAFENMLKSANK